MNNIKRYHCTDPHIHVIAITHPISRRNVVLYSRNIMFAVLIVRDMDPFYLKMEDCSSAPSNSYLSSIWNTCSGTNYSCLQPLYLGDDAWIDFTLYSPICKWCHYWKQKSSQKHTDTKTKCQAWTSWHFCYLKWVFI